MVYLGTRAGGIPGCHELVCADSGQDVGCAFNRTTDHHRALGIALLWGPKGARILLSEVPLYETAAPPLPLRSLFVLTAPHLPPPLARPPSL